MVIGNGMLAKAFKAYILNPAILIFASGVSNSKEVCKSAFEREINLLKTITADTKFIYFSTCSIYDESLQNSLYVKHKLYMEGLIKENFKNFLIFRLPNVVGNTDNVNTFYNFFKNKIIKKEPITIQDKASRYLIDASDLSKWLPGIIEDPNQQNKIINVCLQNNESVEILVKNIAKSIGNKPNIVIAPGGTNYNIENSFFLSFLSKKFTVSDNYNQNLIEKYL